MIDAIKNVLTNETVIEIATTTKAQVIDTVSTSKLASVVVGGTVATTFTSSEFAQWSAGFASMIFGGKMLVDAWARFTEITMKKRSQRIEMKRQERELDSNN